MFTTQLFTHIAKNIPGLPEVNHDWRHGFGYITLQGYSRL